MEYFEDLIADNVVTPYGDIPLCSNPTPNDDGFAHYARLLIENKIQAINPPFINPHLTQSIHNDKQYVPVNAEDPVGIIGAGVGGLYAAMILKSLDIPYQILEASNRTGGRVLTHKFCPEEHDQAQCNCDYFDAGAMRFPKIGMMNRLFHLFDHEKLNSNGRNLRAHLTPYVFRDPNTFVMFNRARYQLHNLPDYRRDPFNYGIMRGGNIEPNFIRIGSSNLVWDSIKEFYDGLKKNPEEGTEVLIRFDEYSLRGYMANYSAS